MWSPAFRHSGHVDLRRKVLAYRCVAIGICVVLHFLCHHRCGSRLDLLVQLEINGRLQCKAAGLRCFEKHLDHLVKQCHMWAAERSSLCLAQIFHRV